LAGGRGLDLDQHHRGGRQRQPDGDDLTTLGRYPRVAREVQHHRTQSVLQGPSSPRAGRARSSRLRSFRRSACSPRWSTFGRALRRWNWIRPLRVGRDLPCEADCPPGGSRSYCHPCRRRPSAPIALAPRRTRTTPSASHWSGRGVPKQQSAMSCQSWRWHYRLHENAASQMGSAFKEGRLTKFARPRQNVQVTLRNCPPSAEMCKPYGASSLPIVILRH
jgi:hypothetical protein